MQNSPIYMLLCLIFPLQNSFSFLFVFGAFQSPQVFALYTLSRDFACNQQEKWFEVCLLHVVLNQDTLWGTLLTFKQQMFLIAQWLEEKIMK